jgi:tetratricopeptide (TPR) repeat protein
MVLSEAKNIFKEALRLHRTGRFEEALASYDKVIALMPDNAEVYSNRGIVLQGLRRFAEALASYDKAVALMPGYADAHNNRGNALQDLKRFEEAVASYDTAIALKPDHANARNNRGNALSALKRFEQALASYDAAIAVKPGYAEAYNNRGGVLRELKRPEEARASYEKAVALRPDYAAAWNSLGLVQYEMKHFEEALASYDRAVAIRPTYAEAFNNRGLVLWELSRLVEALASYDAAISLSPGYSEAYHNRAASLFELKRLDEALASCEAAISLRPDFAGAINFRGAIKLLLGRFAEGWADHHWRWKTKNFSGSRPLIAAPEWRGEDLKGRSIFVNMEQGLGDTMQFGRYLPLLARRGAKVTFFANRKLHRLLRPLCESIEVVDSFDGTRVFDFQCPMMSLPLHFGTDISSIPADIPYLHAEDAFVAKWKSRLGSKGFKIGIFWHASVVGTVGRGRSIPLREFFPLARIKGVRLISLQKNFGLDQLAEIPPDIEIETLGEDFDSGPDAFLDTAAIISQLDLVISADTSIAHLSGALGGLVWVALKYVPDWRWLLDREDSPWYPTARLFRQERAGDWTGVFSRIKAELTFLMEERL